MSREKTARFYAVVAGASGVVGRRLATHLAALPDWEVTGLSRRAPANVAFKTLAVDLTNAADCQAILGTLTDTTHIFYAARYDHKTTAPEPIDLNTNMLRHLVDAVQPRAANLQHIHMVQGSKYYGSNLPSYKTPALESDPRVANNANFYYAQEDFLVARQQSSGQRWSWSASRPHAICDFSTGFARALGLLIAVYASICKARGEPLSFPGTVGNYNALYQCTEAKLLARAIQWMSTEPTCANQAFNITNGDFIRWKNLWPLFADYFGLPLGGVNTQRLGDTTTTPQAAQTWAQIVKKYHLKTNSYVTYDKLVVWPYGDFVFGPAIDIMSSTIKARQLGFRDAMDTGRMFIDLFDYYRREKVIP